MLNCNVQVKTTRTVVQDTSTYPKLHIDALNSLHYEVKEHQGEGFEQLTIAAKATRGTNPSPFLFFIQ